MAAFESPPPLEQWSFRPPPAAAVSALDSITPMPVDRMPRSSEPGVGLLFVSCTRLWRAEPDGSNPQKLLTLPGISSPVYSPDARTVVFFVATPDRYDLWMIAADGSRPTRVGTVVKSADSAAYATALTWAPDGRELAFALVSPGEDPRAGGSVIWTLDLDRGTFDRVATGWPAPFYVQGRLGFSGFDDWNPFEFGTEGGRRLGAQLSGADTDLALSMAPGQLFYSYDRKTVVLSKGPGGIELSLRSRYSGRESEIDPPSTHRYPESARPAVSSDGHTIIVELVDFTGERDVGLYDWRDLEWTVIDYAWEPATSPVPALSGPMDAPFVKGVVERLLYSWNYAPRRVETIAGSPLDPTVIPMKWLSFKLEPPRRAGEEWKVPGFVWGKANGQVLFGEFDFEVGSRRGRLAVTPRPTSGIAQLNTLADAAVAIDRMINAEVVVPQGLPGGQTFSSVASWGNSGTITTKPPKPGGKGGGYIELSYGAVGFYGGCGGGSGKSRPVTVGDQPALFDKVRTIRQVIWPATPGHEKDASFSVYGSNVSRTEILEVAESIESLR